MYIPGMNTLGFVGIPDIAVIAIVALSTPLFLVALIHAIASQNLKGGEKALWVLVIFLIPCVGPLLYFMLGRRRAEVKETYPSASGRDKLCPSPPYRLQSGGGAGDGALRLRKPTPPLRFARSSPPETGRV